MPASAAQLEQLIQQYGNDVLRYAYLYLDDRGLAEDLAQEVFLRVYQHWPRFRGASAPRTWIMRITINACKDMLKSKQYRERRLEKPLVLEEYRQAALQYELELPQDLDPVWQAIRQLPQIERAALILRYYEGYSTAEAADILRISPAALKSRLSRTCAKLRNELKGKVDLDD